MLLKAGVAGAEFVVTRMHNHRTLLFNFSAGCDGQAAVYD